MWKKFIQGLVFGAGFAIAFELVMTAYFYFVLPYSFNSNPTEQDQETLSSPPSIETPKHYLGVTSVYSSQFSDVEATLGTGPGLIIGNVSAATDPAGLKVRLAFNGSVWNQWSVVDGQVKYSIPVPLGEYQVLGYEFDHSTAVTALPKQILHPDQRATTKPFLVSETQNGAGLSFSFVEPVVKQNGSQVYDKVEDIVLSSRPYNGAHKYVVTLIEKDSDGAARSTTVSTTDRLVVSQPQINLGNHPVTLTRGKFYSFEVYALDEAGEALSKSVREYSGYDFRLN